MKKVLDVFFLTPSLSRHLLPTETTGWSSNSLDAECGSLLCFCVQTWEEIFQKLTIGKQMSNKSCGPVGLGRKTPHPHFPSIILIWLNKGTKAQCLTGLSSLSNSAKAYIFQVSWLCINEGIVRGKERVGSWFSVPYVSSSATNPLHYGFWKICSSN